MIQTLSISSSSFIYLFFWEPIKPLTLQVKYLVISTGTLRSIRRLGNLVKVPNPWCFQREIHCLLPLLQIWKG